MTDTNERRLTGNVNIGLQKKASSAKKAQDDLEVLRIAVDENRARSVLKVAVLEIIGKRIPLPFC